MLLEILKSQAFTILTYSVNFYNKADYGITVYRDKGADMVYIHFIKIKFKHLKDGGTIACKYNFKNGRYEPETLDFNTWDNQLFDLQ